MTEPYRTFNINGVVELPFRGAANIASLSTFIGIGIDSLSGRGVGFQVSILPRPADGAVI